MRVFVSSFEIDFWLRILGFAIKDFAWVEIIMEVKIWRKIFVLRFKHKNLEINFALGTWVSTLIIMKYSPINNWTTQKNNSSYIITGQNVNSMRNMRQKYRIH